MHLAQAPGMSQIYDPFRSQAPAHCIVGSVSLDLHLAQNINVCVCRPSSRAPALKAKFEALNVPHVLAVVVVESKNADPMYIILGHCGKASLVHILQPSKEHSIEKSSFLVEYLGHLVSELAESHVLDEILNNDSRFQIEHFLFKSNSEHKPASFLPKTSTTVAMTQIAATDLLIEYLGTLGNP